MISKVLVVLASSCLLGSVLAAPQIIAGVVPVAPAHVTTQYHSQNELGEYAYGYSGGPSAKHEEKTADGITKGEYSYIDAHGLPQSVSYFSDPVNGFRAAGTNFPVEVPAFVPHPAAPGLTVPIAEAVAPPDTVELYEAKAYHFAEKAAATHAALAAPARKRRDLSYLAPFPYTHAALPLPHAYAAAPFAYPHAAGYAYPAPAPVPVAPVVAAPSASQHHSQNELGEYSYGYANQDSAKEEVKTADGITRGSYSYRDAYGLPQTLSYISDPHNGFRAAGTNLPVAPIA